MSDESKPSTIGGYANQAVGTVQDAFGQLTGTGQSQSQGETRRDVGQDQVDASRTSAKIGPVTATAEGGVHVDSQKRTDGSWNQTLGSGKQFIGGVIGSDSLKQQGREQYDRGVQEEAEGRAQDYVQGVSDRVKGTIGTMTADLVGNPDAKAEYQRQHDDGKAGQRSVEDDLQREADSEQRRRQQNQ